MKTSRNRTFLSSRNTFKIVSYLGMIMLFMAILSSCSTHRAKRLRNKSIKEWKSYEWKQDQKNTDGNKGWTVYSRKVKDSKFKEFKIEGEICVSPSKSIESLREKTENSQKYVDEKEGFINVLSSTQNETVIYSVYNLPFPFRAREMCERFLFTENKETGVLKISWKEDWAVAPPKTRGMVRMPIVRGSWEFKPIDTDKSMATYIVHAEPGGMISAWMANSTVGKGLAKELKSIEEIAYTLEINGSR